jgi:1,2-diacylglycerol 3-alpha-glucosyltransferase
VRIALVSDCYWPRVNGVTVSLQTFRDELIRRGHEVIILCPDYPPPWEKAPKEPSVRRFASRGSSVSKEDRLIGITAFPAFFRALDRFNPDVIHINTELTANVAARIFAYLRFHPILVTSHTDYEDYICNYIRFVDRRLLRAVVRFIMRFTFRTADIIITPSRHQQRKLKDYNIHKRFVVIPTGISDIFVPQPKDAIKAYRASLDERFPSLKGKRILLFTGRITVEKDAKFLLPVLRRLRARRKDVALLFAGDGPARPHIEALALRSGMSDSCAFMGYVKYAELPLVYASADVFVFPSKTETLGLCTIEAMGTGLPVVAIGEMGTLDVMRGDNGGFMVPNDETAFTEAVLALLNDEGLRNRKSAEARAWAKQYRIGTTTDRLERLYRVVSARHSRLLKLRSGIR